MLELKSQKVWKILNAKQLKGAFVQLSLIILWPPSIPRLYGESFVFPCFACSHFVLDLILHLLGQSANFPQVCIRRETGYCSIGWLQSDDPDSFKVILIIFMNSMKLFLPSHFQSMNINSVLNEVNNIWFQLSRGSTNYFSQLNGCSTDRVTILGWN